MKLHVRRTICVGFAFFLISAFWQAYDTIIPKMLTDRFGMSQTISGFVMAADNILAIFLLPLFGALSDKTVTRIGRRTPYILFGTIVACGVLVLLSVADSMQLTSLGAAARTDDPAGLCSIYDTVGDRMLRTSAGEEFVLADVYTREDFSQIRVFASDGSVNPAFSGHVSAARQAYAAEITRQNRLPLLVFMGMLLLLLVSMAVFRSPAVALMPDVTLKPLRSKGNAIINLMGSAGGILVLLLGTVMATGAIQNAMMPYRTFFFCVAGLMLAALIVFCLTVRENRFAREMRAQSVALGLSEESEEAAGPKSSEKLPKDKRRSLGFLLSAIVLWFMAYNAVTSKYSVYASRVLNLDYNLTLLLAQAAAICAYLPVGILSSRIGRKKMILAGIVMLTLCFFLASFLRQGSPMLLMNLMFALAGIGWATINVNSFPMVVEMARNSDIGRYTGYYYSASMAAQIITPMLSGACMDAVGLTALFPYAAVFAALSFVVMLFVRHGDAKPTLQQAIAVPDAD